MDRYGKLVDAQTVVFERLLPGPIERVFDYLWDEDKRNPWGGMHSTKAITSTTTTVIAITVVTVTTAVI